MSNGWQLGWDISTPCGVYYTYATNKATGREVLVKNYSHKDIPSSGHDTFKQLLDDLIQRDTCDGYYDWQPMIARVREHIAKIAKGDTNEAL